MMAWLVCSRAGCQKKVCAVDFLHVACAFLSTRRCIVFCFGGSVFCFGEEGRATPRRAIDSPSAAVRWRLREGSLIS